MGGHISKHLFTLNYVILSEEDEKEMLYPGDIITLREYRGVFGYPIYRVAELHDK